MKQRWFAATFWVAVVAAQTPRFDVVSIKPSNSPDRRRSYQTQPDGRFTVVNVTARQLILQAYQIEDFQISGGPGWVGSDLFDVDAKPESPMTREQVPGALAGMLADRFHLVIQRGTREVPVYALVLAKSGSKLKDAGPVPAGGVRTVIRRGLLLSPMLDTGFLAKLLSSVLGRKVDDHTGLTGKYDARLEWIPDENQIAMFQGMGVPEGFGAPAADQPGATLFTALTEQLGLALESRKGPVEIFAIERVERPSAN